MDRTLVKFSKFLSLILRHRPGQFGLSLDEHGWADIDDVLRAAQTAGHSVSSAVLRRVVTENDKKRFAVSDDGLRIRANQGHSIAVDLELTAVQPPASLFHGTVDRFLDEIRRCGLKRMNRHHVHLSGDIPTATKVGNRRGRAIVLEIQAARMHQQGLTFYRSENGVWLTEAVLPEFIVFPTN